MIDLVNAAFADLVLAELMERLNAAGVPAGEVRTLDRVYDWDQTRSQGLLIDVEHPDLGTVQLPGPPLRWFDAEGERCREERLAPPALGGDEAAIRAWLEQTPAR
ncbi:CoA transferase [Pseudactinotalea sp. Z1732]|uniref:CoA transferase n=1 Tax=Micrococcales TaxID=85006 RepID=UPI003C7E8B28